MTDMKHSFWWGLVGGRGGVAHQKKRQAKNKVWWSNRYRVVQMADMRKSEELELSSHLPHLR